MLKDICPQGFLFLESKAYIGRAEGNRQSLVLPFFFKEE